MTPLRHLSIVLVATLLCTCSLAALGSANFAKVPVGLRQTYADGSSTEFSCDAMARNFDGCVFRVNGKFRHRTYTVQAEKYAFVMFVNEYWYWPGEGTDFSIAVPAACPEERLARLSAEERDDASCRLFLHPKDRLLVPERLELRGMDGVVIREE